MKRYYFDLVESNIGSFDEEGIELPDIQSVQEEAALALAALAKELRTDAARHDNLEIAINVRDDHGLVLRVLFAFENRRLH
jgi:hypothetical protein